MAPIKAKVYHMVKHFKGEPKLSDFAIREEELPPLKEGDILLQAEWLTVDPYMRIMMMRLPEGSKMIGGIVGRVLESRHKDFAVGDHAYGLLGWASHFVCSPDAVVSNPKDKIEKVDLNGLPPSYALGLLGMPGFTAYFGVMEGCRPLPGQTVVVSGAAGAVGSVAGQIARIRGCRVIGFAGSDEKVEWLKQTCKYDFAYNYKTTDIVKALKEAAPNGVDRYFDNVGGAISSAVQSQMNYGGRVAVVGGISGYNSNGSKQELAPPIQEDVTFRNLTLKGFAVYKWISHFPAARAVMSKWVSEGALVYKETVYEGFESMPHAFIDLFRGGNTGKSVVKV